MYTYDFGPSRNPNCDDCLDGRCTMNCSPMIDKDSKMSAKPIAMPKRKKVVVEPPTAPTNSNGLDVLYFHDKLMTIIEGLRNYTPEELSRELARISWTASRRHAQIEFCNLTIKSSIASIEYLEKHNPSNAKNIANQDE